MGPHLVSHLQGGQSSSMPSGPMPPAGSVAPHPGSAAAAEAASLPDNGAGNYGYTSAHPGSTGNYGYPAAIQPEPMIGKPNESVLPGPG